MTVYEFSNQFDLLYNNITSNQAPGLNEYEKSIFLTKAQDELVKNYFEASSQGNTIKKGFDDTILRQMDFSDLISNKGYEDGIVGESIVDPRAIIYDIPKSDNVYIVINESLHLMGDNGVVKGIRQIIPITYLEYSRLMSKPFKQPLKSQAWRLITSGRRGEQSTSDKTYTDINQIKTGVEIIPTSADLKKYTGDVVIDLPEQDADADVNKIEGTVEIVLSEPVASNIKYVIRYVRRPRPIILTDLTDAYGEDLSINGETEMMTCELNEIVHEAILQRAVELAKTAYEGNLQETQFNVEMGKRSE
jgi:hypothetical protein